MAKLAAQTISSMMFIGLASWPRATTHMLGGGSVGSSLGPYWASRRWTSSVASPCSGSTPIRVGGILRRQVVPGSILGRVFDCGHLSS